jgi:hypothetical protein
VTKFAQGSANEAFDLNDLSGLQRALMREALVAAFTRDAFDQLLQDNDASKRLESSWPTALFAHSFSLVSS